MSENVIGLVFDFDETLGPDTIGFLLSKNNIAEDDFWPEVYQMVKEGFDPPLAYMQHLLKLGREGKLDLSPQALSNLGKNLPLFPGLPQAFDELKECVAQEPALKKVKVALEFYIISGGIEDIILGSGIATHINGIFGSSFAYDQNNEPVGIKTAISFTEKTRYLFGINKGLSNKELREDPYQINKVVAKEQRRIPFSQMIYIGDGPSDVPCLSTICQYGGIGIGVVSQAKSFKRGYDLARGGRITVGPYSANYKSDSDMRRVLEETILRLGLEIDLNKKKRVLHKRDSLK